VRDDGPAVGLFLTDADGFEHFDLPRDFGQFHVIRQSAKQCCNLFFGAHGGRVIPKKLGGNRLRYFFSSSSFATTASYISA